MEIHPYSQIVRYILALGFMGEQMISSELKCRKVEN